MKDKLYHNSKLEVRKSPIHGYGVFAKEDIKKGELLEECHYCEVGGYFEDDNFQKRVFFYFDGELPNGQKREHHCIVFGYAPLYNSATEFEDRNVYWKFKKHISYKLFVLSAIKDIKKDEELLQGYLGELDIEE
jgi:SET domain-containing protein